MRIVVLLVCVLGLAACGQARFTTDNPDILVVGDGDVAVEGAEGELGAITGANGAPLPRGAGTDAIPGPLSRADVGEAMSASAAETATTGFRASGRTQARGGLFGGLFGSGAPGAALGAGQVGRVCGLSRRDRGTEVATFPPEGRTKWRIYDTAPGSTAPRTQYITGFDDGCARQVTAAFLVFGAPDVHEAMRYDPNNPQGYSVTDSAYEAIKGRVCGVRRRSPCPSDRIGRLSARTAFVTVYPRFGGMANSIELLLDDGDLVAQAQY